ncbi:hypothetical protein CIHG_04279 [Coccidioides immitis H538.4]|uniref:Uncharacterized protein n=2 Tax=Coccidioides immitis TaxID=5501 RepID=A0A0J8RN16_COCIT|nr:hypothetical protein CIRG_09208 [Coccidioides immitis RMSCC 2394]KMU86490.1 hypothetical protein CIHG_04279 [Coccidioides immitis H538.4]
MPMLAGVGPIILLAILKVGSSIRNMEYSVRCYTNTWAFCCAWRNACLLQCDEVGDCLRVCPGYPPAVRSISTILEYLGSSVQTREARHRDREGVVCKERPNLRSLSSPDAPPQHAYRAVKKHCAPMHGRNGIPKI